MRIRRWIGMMILGAVASACNDVTGPEVRSIVMLLEADTLSEGETMQVQAIVLSVEGDTLADKSVAYRSSNEDIITVSDTGLVSAGGPGRAEVIARADFHTASVAVFVRSQVEAVILSPDSLTIAVNDSGRLTVMVLDTLGVEIADPTVSFSCEGEFFYHAVSPLQCDDETVGPIARIDTTGLREGFVTVRPAPGIIAAEWVVVAMSKGVADTSYVEIQ
ncbi:MAG: Ig-like domain-containing protein [Gemmatimonadota bacterium]